MSRAAPKPMWRLTMDLMDTIDRPFEVAVRRLLKSTLRSVGLRCELCKWEAAPDLPADARPQDTCRSKAGSVRRPLRVDPDGGAE